MAQQIEASELGDLEELEAQIADLFGKSIALGLNTVSSLIGAALEDIGERVERAHGVAPSMESYRQIQN